jgi:hypothetical protein
LVEEGYGQAVELKCIDPGYEVFYYRYSLTPLNEALGGMYALTVVAIGLPGQGEIEANEIRMQGL